MEILTALGLALAFGFIGSVPLTGPIALLVLSRSVEKRFRAAVQIGLGAALAEGLYAGAAFWGFRTLVHSPRLERLSDFLSALVLTALGIYFLRWRFRDHAPPPTRGGRAGWTGFSISILNPTLLLTWSAAVAALTARHWVDGNRWLALPFGLGAALGVAGWELLFVAGIRQFGDRFQRSAIKLLVRCVALVLVALGGWSGYQWMLLVGPLR